jgi:hypothetical protein
MLGSTSQPDYVRIVLVSRRSIFLHLYRNFHNRIGKPGAQPCTCEWLTNMWRQTCQPIRGVQNSAMDILVRKKKSRPTLGDRSHRQSLKSYEVEHFEPALMIKPANVILHGTPCTPSCINTAHWSATRFCICYRRINDVSLIVSGHSLAISVSGAHYRRQSLLDAVLKYCITKFSQPGKCRSIVIILS